MKLLKFLPHALFFLFFMSVIVTGVVMYTYFEPSPDNSREVATQSVEKIMQSVSVVWGWRYVHSWFGGFVLLSMSLLYMLISLSSRKSSSGVISMILFLVFLMAETLVGWMLPWHSLNMVVAPIIPHLLQWLVAGIPYANLYNIHTLIMPPVLLGLFIVFFLSWIKAEK
jgi:quinol-cytochrome oxidoreductase complex cytochrome b subunit